MIAEKEISITDLISFWEKRLLNIEKSLDFLAFSQDEKQKDKYREVIPYMKKTIKSLEHLKPIVFTFHYTETP